MQFGAGPFKPGDCDMPQVCLPMEFTSDLAFQIALSITGIDDLKYLFNTFTESGVNVMGKIGATISIDGVNPYNADYDSGENFYEPQGMEWVCTGLSLVGGTEYIFYMQPTGYTTAFNALLENNQCFSILLYKTMWSETFTGSGVWTVYNGVDYNDTLENDKLAFGFSEGCFYKTIEDCNAYPTALLQYANNSDAFGFYYDFLPELVDNINFLNSIRLPLYLHSLDFPEEQTSYNRSDGSALKIAHRVWEDYKFKTDDLNNQQHLALAIATAHDLVFITCPYADLEAPDYTLSLTLTQFIRTEKINVTWLQENTPRWKTGQGSGVLRLALANAYVNSNCV